MNEESSASEPHKGSRRVAILQSNYIPWKGYFDIIHDVDLFIFYDDVQYTKNDWRNRNKVKSTRGTEWLTIPAGSNENRLICDVELSDGAWQEKHWKTICQLYGKASHFARYSEFFREVYLGHRWTRLSELNQYLIKYIATEILQIKPIFRDSRDYSVAGAKLERLLTLLTKVGAKTYVTGPAARSYIDQALFAEAEIALVWKEYAGYPEYPQSHPPFEHGVTILDLIFHTGPDAPWYVWGWRDNPSAP